MYVKFYYEKKYDVVYTKYVKSSEHGEDSEGSNEGSHLGDHSTVEA